jgi:hypothetical protein
VRVLVACEFSGTVRDAFARRGHDAWSCDLLPSETRGNHIQGDVIPVLREQWDLMIAHPPCTHLCSSGRAWFKNKFFEQCEAIAFVKFLLAAPIPRIALENPVGVLSTRLEKPTQIIQPFQYGHGESKKTCLWLRGLPALVPTRLVHPNGISVGWNGPRSGIDWMRRSRTFQGIADAMAEQWG